MCIGAGVQSPFLPKTCDLPAASDATTEFRRWPKFPQGISMREMKLQELKTKTPAELVSFAEELEVENASTMRKQELMFGILKQLSARETDIVGEGVVEVLPDGFGFLRSPEANYLPGRYAVSDCAPAIQSTGISAAPRRASGTSRFSRSIR
jgi:hypothetical protein